MAFRLVIAEKPSVAQTIAAALGIKGKQDGYIEGGGYLISWCVGHLVQLAEAAAYGEQYKKWSFDSLPILPEEWQYAVDPDKGKQFKTIKELMHRADVSEVVNACDAGREGELIFRFVYEVAGCKKPMRRLWISSMEDGAIKAGFASLKDGRDYGALFASALCRAKADWLIGINATRLFSCLYGKTLNVGRVQTPTLKMLTDRDAAISHFQKEKYYHVRLDLSGADAASERISDKAEADALKHYERVKEKELPADTVKLIYEHGEREIPAGQFFNGNPDYELGKFERFEAVPNDPDALQSLLQEERRSREQLPPGDFKAHIAALRDGLIETEARRIVREMKRHDTPNSPNKTHFMVELSPAFMQLAATKDTDRLFSMLPYKTLAFSKIEGRHGTYALIDKGENRDRKIRKPRPSIRAQLKADKAKTAPKKAAAKTKNHDMEV